jgi:hypothetical protein
MGKEKKNKKRMASHAFSHYTKGYRSCLWTHDHVPKLAKKWQSLATLLKFLVCKEYKIMHINILSTLYQHETLKKES